jgi:hypothetical protein
MGSSKRPVFLPLELEIIDRVYEAAWAQVEARDPFRDKTKDGERHDVLRKQLFAVASSGPVDFDTLYDKVVAVIPETWTTFTTRELGISSPIARGSPIKGHADEIAE